MTEYREVCQNLLKYTGKTTPELPAYAWPGGYPIFYLDKENNVLCSKCAAEDMKDGDEITSGIHWEGDSIHCDECSKEIESAYGPIEDC